MKKLFPLLSLALVFLGAQLMVNCSSPLESINGGQPSPPPPPDTTFVFDTVFETDTVTEFDTVALDTVTIIDTVIIIEPDTSGINMFCGNLSAHQHQIVWLFRNAPGNYRLEFVASTEQDKPPKDLEIDIDGQVFMWRPTENMEFTLDHELVENATIKINSISPHSRGHTVTICLTATPLTP